VAPSDGRVWLPMKSRNMIIPTFEGFSLFIISSLFSKLFCNCFGSLNIHRFNFKNNARQQANGEKALAGKKGRQPSWRRQPQRRLDPHRISGNRFFLWDRNTIRLSRA
jgi:hypothetical protein